MASKAPQYTLLPHRALVTVRGEDRVAFLQGLVSNDMTKVQAGGAVWAAFLTPQGKFLHEFFAAPHHDAILLECERARRDDLITRLARYKLRAKVSLAADDTLTVGVAWGEGASAALETSDSPGYVKEHGAGVLVTDPRLKGAGVRFALAPDQICSLTKLGLEAATPDAYDALRISLGLPDGSRDMEVDKALLLENGFEELHGVDFQKGCYIGQELTARTHYRALIKKRLMPVTAEGPAPAPGTLLTTDDGLEAGEMKSAVGNTGLALVRLDKMQGALHSGTTRLKAHPPQWMKLSANT
jgi:folate-binding protein YgfZ